MPSFQPLDDRILIRPDDAESVTPGGIILPDNAKDKSQVGTVVAVGPGRRVEFTGERIAVCVEEGDRILFSKYQGSEIEINEKQYLVQRESDILGILK